MKVESARSLKSVFCSSRLKTRRYSVQLMKLEWLQGNFAQFMTSHEPNDDLLRSRYLQNIYGMFDFTTPILLWAFLPYLAYFLASQVFLMWYLPLYLRAVEDSE